MPNHSQEIIVQNDYFNRKFILEDSSQFLYCHLETSISNKRDNRNIGFANFCTNSCRQSEAHCPQSTGGNKAIRIFKLIISCSCHLMLAYISYNNCFSLCFFRNKTYYFTHFYFSPGWITFLFYNFSGFNFIT